MTDSHITINSQLAIPASELRYRFSRASGPGGQKVNRTATRVELVFDVVGSPSLSGSQRARLLSKLGGHIDSDGCMRLISQATASQLRNRQDVTERFRQLVRQALYVPRPRRRTRVPRGAREARLRAKQKRSQVKTTRKRVSHDDW